MRFARSSVLRRGLDWTAALPVAIACALVVGGGAWVLGYPGLANGIWGAALLVVGVPLGLSVARRIRRGQTGADVIALLAIAAALALREFLTGAVVALMLSGGEYLDARALGRARRELGALAARAPVAAHRVLADGTLEDIPAAGVAPGDTIVVKQGELIPVDAVVLDGTAVVDESAMTGESLPVSHPAGAAVRSGTVVAGDAARLRALRRANESTYAAIVRLVESAGAERAPTMRIADRAAAVFLPVTLALAVAGWLYTGDPTAAFAVLVVATPCPLILATPVAFVSGVAQAARRGIVVKGAPALERLGHVTVVALDKTGTLTEGHAELIRGDDSTLRLAASADVLSTHPLAAALVAAAHRRNLVLAPATEFSEQHGDGVVARVDGALVRVGRAHFVGQEALSHEPGEVDVHVSIDGVPSGVLTLADPIRASTRETIRRLRRLGADVLVVTGDDPEIAERVVGAVGVERVEAGKTPQEKAAIIADLRRSGEVVAMVGDGINDAPALALADVGIALAQRGATITSETADVVVLDDDIGRVAEALSCGQRTLRIARQGIALGMGLSSILMVFAATGHLAPIAGALAQEAIDVAAIANALRALRGAEPDAVKHRFVRWRGSNRASRILAFGRRP